MIYFEEVLTKERAFCITEKDMLRMGRKVLIKVDDTLKALGKIAQYCQDSKFNFPLLYYQEVLAKQALKKWLECLAEKFNVLKTKGNFNNEIGVPLTIFKLNHSS